MQTLCLFFTDHERVGLDLNAKHQRARILYEIEKVPAHKDFTAAEGKKENTCVSKLAEHGANLRSGHLAVIVMVKVAVNAALVATVGHVKVHAEWHPRIQRPLSDLFHQVHRGPPLTGFAGAMIGSPETSIMPWPAKSFTKLSASRAASSGSTSNCAQIFCSTIS